MPISIHRDATIGENEMATQKYFSVFNKCFYLFQIYIF